SAGIIGRLVASAVLVAAIAAGACNWRDDFFAGAVAHCSGKINEANWARFLLGLSTEHFADGQAWPSQLIPLGMPWTPKEEGEGLKSVLKTIRDWYAARDIDLNFSLQGMHWDDTDGSYFSAGGVQKIHTLASDMGLQVEQRRMDFLQEVNTFREVAAVGTAAVVLPIRSLTMREKTFHFEKHEVMAKLKTQLEAIQELGQLFGPQRSTFFEVMRRTRTDGQGSLFPVRLHRPGCESEELVPSAWPARLDTRFRELQRRGNEIAGDSSRPMKEIDASEYLRELETFHAEQERYVEQVREILKSNPSSGAPGAPGAGAGILGSARLEDLRGPGAIGAGTSMPMAGMPNAAPSGVGLGAGSGLRTGPATGMNPLGGGGGPMQSQPSLPSGLGGGFGKALPVNSLPSLGGVNSASGAAGIRPDMRLPKIEAPGLSSLEEMGSVKLNTAVLPDSGTSVCSGGASCGENQSRQS
ncbi:ilvE, partial [Symbiodinium necroappetens]